MFIRTNVAVILLILVGACGSQEDSGGIPGWLTMPPIESVLPVYSEEEVIEYIGLSTMEALQGVDVELNFGDSPSVSDGRYFTSGALDMPEFDDGLAGLGTTVDFIVGGRPNIGISYSTGYGGYSSFFDGLRAPPDYPPAHAYGALEGFFSGNDDRFTFFSKQSTDAGVELLIVCSGRFDGEYEDLVFVAMVLASPEDPEDIYLDPGQYRVLRFPGRTRRTA